MKCKYILFDLDGTITDSADGIINSVLYALKKFNIQVPERNELYRFIGPPLWESFEKCYGFTKEEADTAVRYFREYYRERGIFECSLYNGIEELLKSLKDNGRIIILATSKSEMFAGKILEYFDVIKYFTYIAGSCHDGTRVEKYEVIKYALENCNISDMSEVIMIGDRKHDIIGAKEAGIKSIGVLYGYGGREELEKAGADYIAETVEDVMCLCDR